MLHRYHTVAQLGRERMFQPMEKFLSVARTARRCAGGSGGVHGRLRVLLTADRAPRNRARQAVDVRLPLHRNGDRQTADEKGAPYARRRASSVNGCPTHRLRADTALGRYDHGVATWRRVTATKTSDAGGCAAVERRGGGPPRRRRQPAWTRVPAIARARQTPDRPDRPTSRRPDF